MSAPADNDFKLPPALELDRIISLQEAEKISSLSVDSWKRHHSDKVVELSPRRRGVRGESISRRRFGPNEGNRRLQSNGRLDSRPGDGLRGGGLADRDAGRTV